MRWASECGSQDPIFSRDVYLVDGWEIAQSVFGDGLDAFCAQHTYLLVKPDALATRQMKTVLGWLEANGWSVRAVRGIRFCRHSAMELWRYNWSQRTRRHIAVLEALLSQHPGVLLILRSERARGMDASRRLALEKGPPDPRHRAPGQLRRVLGDLNSLLNHVHSPDGPAGFLRELSVLLPAAELHGLLNDLKGPLTAAEVFAVVTEKAYFSEHWDELSLAAVLGRLNLDSTGERLVRRLAGTENNEGFTGDVAPVNEVSKLLSFLRKHAVGNATDYSIALCASYAFTR
jgi:nucleoside diphosphate kinase